MENYYNYSERIQRRMLKSNLRYLLSVIFQADLATGEVDEIPKLKIKFSPLWSMSDTEQVDLELKKAQIQQTIAATAQIYVQMEVIDSSEVARCASPLLEKGQPRICLRLLKRVMALPEALPTTVREGIAMINQSTIDQLTQMKFSVMAKSFREQLESPAAYEKMGFEERFALLVDEEWNRRQKNKLRSRLVEAHLDAPLAAVEDIE